MSLLRQNTKFQMYKPVHYEWAYEGYQKMQRLHWLADEIPLGEDVVDFSKLEDRQQEMLKNILRLFTQNDVEALSGYAALANIIKPTEVKMWLFSAGNSENIHIDAYSLLTDTLGFDEVFYSEFLDIPVMERKIDYLEKAKVRKYEDYQSMGLSDAEIDKKFRQDVIKMVGVYAAGLEGIELMAQFALLLAWQELGQFKGMSQINTYSIKDELIHQTYNTKLFLTLTEENSDVYSEDVKSDIRKAIVQVSEQEFAMLDYLYDVGDHPTITKEQAKEYVKFMTDRALIMMELEPVYGVSVNPIKFMGEILSNVEFANFFEVEVTAYSKQVLLGEWGDVDTTKTDFLKIKYGGETRYEE